MKAEIIDGRLVIFPETSTELYAMEMLKEHNPDFSVETDDEKLDGLYD